MLEVRIAPHSKGFTFQVLEQSQEVTNFLLKNNSCYNAPNGWKVAISKQPEVRVDERVIFLRGTRSTRDEYIDANSYVAEGDKAVKKLIDQIEKALASMITAIKTRKVLPFENVKVITLSGKLFNRCNTAPGVYVVVNDD